MILFLPKKIIARFSLLVFFASFSFFNSYANNSKDHNSKGSACASDPVTAGPNQTVCAAVGTATMAANTPTSGTFSWTKISGSGSITNSLSPTTQITGLTVGQSVFRWTLVQGTCTPSTSDMTITVEGIPTATVTPTTQTICVTTGSANLSANTPTSGTGSWSLTSGPVCTITNSLSPNTTVTGLTAGTRTFRWRVVNSCGNANATMTIVTSATPTPVNASVDQTICVSNNATMNATNPTTGTGAWTKLSGPGNITNPLLRNTTVTGFTVGTGVFRWTVTNGACSAFDDMTIMAQGLNTHTAGPNQTVCVTTGSTVMAGQTQTAGITATWAKTAGPAGGNITGPNAPTATITTLGVGTYTFRWRWQSACPTVDAFMNIVVTPTVTPSNAGPNQTVCAIPGTATMAAVAATVGTGTWTKISGPGSITSINNPSTTITGLTSGSSVFRWTISNGGCTSISQMTIVTNDVPDNAVAGSNQTVCVIGSGSVTMAANTPTFGVGTWSLVSGPACSITNSLLPNTTVTGLTVGTRVFRWRITNGVCVSNSQMTVVATAQPSDADAGPSLTICETTGSVTMAANTTTAGVGTWSLISGPSCVITNSLSNTTTVTGLTPGLRVFQWKFTNGICTSTSFMSIQTDPAPSVADAGLNYTLCINSPNYTMTANTPTSGVGTWSLISGSGTITNSLSPTTTITNLALGDNVFRWEITTNGACPNSISDVTLTVKDLSDIAVAGPNQYFCIGSPTVTMAANTPTSGTGFWSLISGFGIIDNPLSPTTNIYGLAVGDNVFRWTIDNNPCPISISDVTLAINQPPTPSIAGPNQTVCVSPGTATMAANIPTIGIGTWSLVSGSGSITNSLSPTTTITGLAVGANIFRWTINSQGCVPSVDDVTITVNDVPTTANAGSNQTICISTGSVTMAANSATVGVGTWTLISGGGTITNSLSPTTSITGLPVGNNVFQWSITNGVCPPSTSNVTIVVSPLPSTANAGSSQTICISTGSVTMSANTATIGVGTWSLVSGGGVITNSLLPNTTITSIPVGINVFRWTISSNPCTPSISDVTITVNDLPTTASAGSSQTLCVSTPSYVLTGTTPTVGVGTWSLISGSGTITNSVSPTTTVTGLASGPNVFSWTISNGVCPASVSTVTITINLQPSTASAGPSQTVCITTPTALMAANNATVGVGSWSLISGGGTITNSLSPSTTITGLPLGINVFRWTITNPPCPASISDMTITVDDAPSVASAGSNQTICISTGSVTMAANNATVGVGTWSLISGGGTITNSLSPVTTITGLPAGNNVFRWTISNGVCAPSVSNVTITVNQIPSLADAGPTQTICITTGSVTMAGNPPTVGVGTWSLISGGGVITNSLLPNTTVTSLPLGTNVFRWTISNPPCLPSVSDVTIYVNPVPSTAAAGSNQTICITTGSVTMSANTPTSGVGTWSLISGGGVITNSLLPNTTITGLPSGNNIFRWTIANPPCSPSISNVTITVNPATDNANAGPSQTICISTPTALMAANTPTSGVGTWSLISGGGVITNSLLPNTTVTSLPLGTNVFRWTISNNPCLATISDMTIVVNPAPSTAAAGANQTVCISTPTALMAANTPTSGVGTWSLISGGGVITNSLLPNTTITGMPLGNNIFRWTIANPPCLATISDVTITVNPAPDNANAGPSQTICISTPTALMAANTPTSGVGTWSLISGGGVITNSLLPNTTVTSLPLGTNVFRWTISNNPCLATISDMTIVVNPAPSTAAAGSNQTVCISTPTALMAANTPTSGVGTWSLISGGGVITNSLLPNTTITGMPLGNNIFRWTIANPPCLATISDVTITVNPAPDNANAGPSQTVCISTPTALMAANTPTSGVGTWSLISGGGVITNSLLPNTTITSLPLGTNVFRWTISNNPCLATISDMTIVVNPAPSTAAAGANQTVCISTPTALMAANTPTSGVGTWSLISGGGVITNSLLPNTTITGMPLGNNIFRWTIANPPCLATISDVTITVNPAPDNANAGPSQTICISTPTALMAANTPTSGVGTWSLISGGGVITNSLLPNTTITSLPLGTNVFRWTISNNPCLATISDMTIVVNPAPSTAAAGSNQTVCISTPTALMAANTPTSGVGTWSLISGGGVITNSLLPNTTITSLPLGTNIFRWTIANPPCLATISDVTITVNPAPDNANAGPSQTICISTPTALMAANTPTSGVGTWSLISGGGVITNSLLPNTTVTSLPLGTNVFRWTISNNPCLATISDMTIVVNPAPSTAAAGANQTICITTGSVTMSANTPTSGVGTWSLISGGGVITNSLLATTTVTALPIGDNVFRWTIDNPPCSPSVSDVTITVRDIPSSAVAGPNQTICATNPTATMAANTATVGTGRWTVIVGSGVITNSLSPTTTVTGLGLGINVLRWRITNNPCTASSSNVTITVNPAPDNAVAGPNQTVCISTPTTVMAANTPTTGTGTWSLMSGSGTISNSLSPVTPITGLGLGINVFRWTISSSACIPTISDMTITVNPAPDNANAGPSQTICISTPTALMAANTPTSGVGTWSLISGGGVITNSLLPNTTVTSLPLGTNVFRWTISNNPCLATISDMTIVVNPAPSTAAAGANQTVCISTPTALMAANTPTSGVGTWSLISGGGVITNSLIANTTVTALPIGDNVFRWTIANPPCLATISDVTITVKPAPDNANAGPSQTICISTPTALMAANTPTSGVGTWSLISGGGVITNSVLPNTTVTSLPLGTNVFRWTISNNPCLATTSDVTITVKPLPDISVAGSNKTICVTSSFTFMTANTPTSGVGTWSLISGGGVITNSLLPNTSVTSLPLGNNVFRWTIDNPPCSPSVSDVTITVVPSPDNAFAGSNQTVCISTPTALMAANTPTSGVGTWSLISGGGVITNSLLPNTTITGMPLGDNIFRWTISNNPCLATTSDVTITVNQVPTTAAAGSNQTVCISSGSVTMSANTATVGVGTWSLISGGGTITNSLSPVTTVTALPLGDNIFRWTIANPPCGPTVSDVTITVKDVPTTAIAGPNQTICFNTPTITMAANTPTVGVGTWSLVSGGGTITNSLSPTTSVTGLTIGVHVFRWEITNPPCGSSISDMTVTVNPGPTIANAGSNQTICVSTGTTVMAANTPTVGVGSWSLISGGGIITNSLSPTTSITSLPVGNNVFRWTITDNPCVPSTADMTITVNPDPSTAVAGSNQTICISTGSVTMAANTPTIGIGTWSLVSGGGVITNSLLPNTTVTGLPLGTNIFRWTISNSPCNPSVSDVTITVKDVPSVAAAGSNQTICITTGSVTMAANNATVGVGTWSLISGGGVITNSLSPTTTITALPVGNNIFRWTIDNSPCSPSISDVTITVNDIPSTALAGSNQTLCISSPTTNMTANTATVGVGTWSLISGGGTVTNSLSPTSLVTGLPIGNNVFRWTISNPPCLATISDVTITVNDVPTTALAGPSQTICFNTPTISMAANTPTVGVGTWSIVQGSATISNSLSPTTIVSGLGLGINVFRWTIDNPPCLPSSSDMTVIVNPGPSTSAAGPNQTVCISNPTVTMAANTPTQGIGTWSLVSGGGVITNSLLPNTTITGLPLGANVFEWKISDNPCLPSISNVTIYVNQVPSAADAGLNQVICITNPNTILNANTPTVGIGTWSLISGGGTITNSLSPNSPVTNLPLGDNVFRWTIDNPPCGPSISDVTITVNPAADNSLAGPSQTICISANTATMAANTPTSGVGTWSLVTGTGIITNSLSPTTTISGLGVGINIFSWTIYSNPCSPSVSQVTIQVNQMPTVSSAGSNQTICISSGSATMAANTPVDGVGTWSLISGGGVITNSLLPNTTVTGLPLGDNVFRWEITNSPCLSSLSDVTITVMPAPSLAYAGSDQTICSFSTTITSNSAAIGTGNWIVLSGGGIVTSPTSTTTTITGLSVGTNSIVWSISNSVCTNSEDTVVITVDAMPTLAAAGPDQTVCLTGTGLQGNIPTIGVGNWTVIAGPGAVSSPNLGTSGVSGLATGTNVLVWTISNGVCPSNSDTVVINKLPPTQQAFAGNDTTIYINQIYLNGNLPIAGFGTWELVSGNANIMAANVYTTQIIRIKPGMNTLKWKITDVCGTTEDEININFIQTDLPNAISPNGDGVNDFFEIPYSDSFTNMQIKVLNRWGNIVFENTDYKNDWNGLNQEGQPLTEDTYFYIIKLDDKIKTGNVLIKR